MEGASNPSRSEPDLLLVLRLLPNRSKVGQIGVQQKNNANVSNGPVTI